MNSVTKEKLSALCGYITGDGHIQIKEWRYLTSFYNNNCVLIKIVNQYFLDVFGVSGKIYLKEKGNIQYRLFIISKDVTLCLKKLGVPVGRKTDIHFTVPKFILNSSKNSKASYLSAIFDCECCVYAIKNRWRIEIEMYRREDIKNSGLFFMNQIKSLFGDLGIKSSPVRLGRKICRLDGTKSIAIKLDIEINEFEKFYKYVGFADKSKEAKLLQAIAEMQRSGRSRRYL